MAADVRAREEPREDRLAGTGAEREDRRHDKDRNQPVDLLDAAVLDRPEDDDREHLVRDPRIRLAPRQQVDQAELLAYRHAARGQTLEQVAVRDLEPALRPAHALVPQTA